MASIVVSQEAIDFIGSKKMKRPNLVVYRDVSGVIMGYTTRRLKFEPKVKLADKEPNELFVVTDNSYGFSIWIERGLLPTLAKCNSVLITLKKGLIKGLEIKLEPELVGAR